jgi:exosortase/archaeosortase family protein
MNPASGTGARPPWRFALKTVLGLALFLLLYREEILGRVLDPWAVATARAAAGLLEIGGMAVVRSAAELHHPGGFAYEVVYRCTGILPAAILAVAVAAYPATLARKAAGLAVGIPVLLLLNLARLVHLFYVGVNAPERFELMHGVLWEAALIGATIGIFVVWRSREAPSAGAGDRITDASGRLSKAG